MRITITIDTRGLHVNVNGRTFTARTGRTAGRIERDRYNDRWSDAAQRRRDVATCASFDDGATDAFADYINGRDYTSDHGTPRTGRTTYVNGVPYAVCADGAVRIGHGLDA